MKYFEIQDTPELKYAPQIKNWYGKFDVRDIKLESYPKLPERQLFIIEPSENTIFTDIILSPFLLVSPKVMHVIKMYKDCCFYRDIILLDQLKKKSQLYYLPVFNETNSILVAEKKYKDGLCVFDSTKQKVDKVIVNKNIFWANDSIKRHTIISLDLAESLIRREIFGLGIREVELFLNRERGENNERREN